MEKFSHNNKALLTILNDEQVETIHEKALELLEQVGVRFEHPEALKLLEKSGCTIDTERQMVKFPRELVLKAIDSAPSEFTLYNVSAEERMHLGQNKNYFAPGPGAPNFTDQQGMKLGTIAYFDEALRIQQASPYLDMGSTSVAPGDYPPELLDVYVLYKMIEAVDKPLLAESWNEHTEQRIVSLMESPFVDTTTFKEKPFAMIAACPAPPMKWEGRVIDVTLKSVEFGIPVFVCPSPVMGISAPVTVAGAVLLHTVEALSYLTFIQCLSPGAPVLYGGICSTLDMRYTYNSSSAAEACLCTAGYAAMARYYGLPSLSFLAQSDSKSVDYQAGFETAMGALVSALSGIDVIYGAGTLDSYMSSSNEKLALDGQLLGYIRMIAEGIEFSDDTLAMDLIEEVGPGDGDTYLETMHTAQWYRKSQCLLDPMIDRKSYQHDPADRVDIYDRARAYIDNLGDIQTRDAQVAEAVSKAMAAIGQDMGIDEQVSLHGNGA